MIPTSFSLQSMQETFRDIYAKLKPLQTGNIDLSGRRVINAGQSADTMDYLTKIELIVDDPLTFDVNAYFRR